MSEVKEVFKEYSASEIKNFSHKEDAYTKTSENEIINYNFAISLNA